MSRIQSTLENLKSEGRKALIPYVTAGDPEPGVTVGLLHDMVKAGADIIELGVPFSDPMADGPVIQLATERALKHNVSLRDCLGMVAEFRECDQSTPIVLMGYLNPVEIMGYSEFAEAAAKAGVDGVLTVDMPPEEAEDYIAAMQAQALDCIFLLSPTSSNDRIRLIAEKASGYIYYVSLKGVTGAAKLDVGNVAEHVARIRALTDLPIGVGFGISNAESAAAISVVSDGVVVGSALVKRIANLADKPDEINPAVSELLAEMRAAMDANVA